jgi:predicted NBD/HSP70 family sugar kinase
MSSAEYLAIDFGATHIRLGFFAAGEIVKYIDVPTPAQPAECEQILHDEISRFSSINLKSIAVGAAGYWDKACILKQSLNLPAYIDYPLWTNLSKNLKIPLYLKTDVELAAYGEAVIGEQKKFSNLLYINMGTGFSGAYYESGKIFSTDYSPTVRLDFLVQANQFLDKKPLTTSKEGNIAVLASTLINLSMILSPQHIAFGGGKVTPERWHDVIEPSIKLALTYLHKHQTYKISMSKAKLTNATLMGAYQFLKEQ